MFSRDDFKYQLPEELIAQQPPASRGDSRLLMVQGQGCVHRKFSELPGLLRRGDLLVVNDTRVLKGRLLGEKDTGGRVELLLERVESERVALCQARASKALQPGRSLTVGDARLDVLGREDQFFRIGFPVPVLDLLETHGQVPLPPYIQREAGNQDVERYQTIWGREPGAVAAPTAGLHFSEALLEEIEARGVRIVPLTLHVGAGTFQPVRSRSLDEHRMHEERYRISAEVADAVAATAADGGRVVAVGTTVVRALESAATGDYRVNTGAGATRLFITPGYRFQVVDAMVTNFHLPESTLLMLVCAFAGYHPVMSAYQEAVRERYRFFSYGDAMLLERCLNGA